MTISEVNLVGNASPKGPVPPTWSRCGRLDDLNRCAVSCFRWVFMRQYSVGDVQVASSDRAAGGPASGSGVARDRPALSDMPVAHTPVELNRFAVGDSSYS